jgi:hypothetical protein
MESSGAGGKLIHEKNQKQKISRHCPFNLPFKVFLPLYAQVFISCRVQMYGFREFKFFAKEKLN